MKKLVKHPGMLVVATAFTAILLYSSKGFTRPGELGSASDSASVSATTSIRDAATLLYNHLGLANTGLSKAAFLHGFTGYNKLQSKGMITNQLLTIADMSQPSGHKRLYIIDMLQGKLLKNTLVAHGRNSGDRMASHFSNIPSSLQSSLGFYVTRNTYQGNNGYSLRLDGLEDGFNNKAFDRAIVMHGAAYVNEQLARSGRIGRSWGCPAVSEKEHKEIINLIKGGSCLFIYAPQANYLARSSFVAHDTLL